MTINKSDDEKKLSSLIEEMFNKIENFDTDKFINNYTAESIIDHLDIL